MYPFFKYGCAVNAQNGVTKEFGSSSVEEEKCGPKASPFPTLKCHLRLNDGPPTTSISEDCPETHFGGFFPLFSRLTCENTIFYRLPHRADGR